MHHSILITDLSYSVAHRTCFEHFSAQINNGDRIALIGRNGAGKSSLLQIIAQQRAPTNGKIVISSDVVIGYVPQLVETFDSLSGGQRFNKALSHALALQPNLLLLDEPTNHLDEQNKKSLMRMIQQFPGTVVVVSHDEELLRTCITSFWHLDPPTITISHQQYDEYLQALAHTREKIEKKLSTLERARKASHNSLMKEQERSKKKKEQGEKRYGGDTIALRAAQSKGEHTESKHKAALRDEKETILKQLDQYRLAEVIVPTFSLTAADTFARAAVSIQNGSCGYDSLVLEHINLQIGGRERIALKGKNGSGKTTLIKAIMADDAIKRSGDWHTLDKKDIGYLDQHYATLDRKKTAVEIIDSSRPDWNHAQVRRHLNDFLFRKNEEVNIPCDLLSGGEKARLCLALIAAKTPRLLILDELTNNLDLETRAHVTQVIRNYPGALIAISHDADFLNDIHIETVYLVHNKTVELEIERETE